MTINISDIPVSRIEAIIFDFGGVIMDVDIHQTVRAFADLNIGNFTYRDIIAENGGIFRDLEVGLITPQGFIDKFRADFPTAGNIPDEAIWQAWNALLQPYQPDRIALVKEIKKLYKTYLFSNTNYPHRIAFKRMFRDQFGYDLEELFIKCFYSDELHLRKPDPLIYTRLTEDLAVEPGKILFIDDNPANIAQAQAAGWNAYQLAGGKTIRDIFSV